MLYEGSWMGLLKYYINLLLSRGKRISFCWSPGHVGISGNETADKAAKNSSTRDNIDFNPVPYNDTKSSIKFCIMDKFQNVWSSITTNTKLKSIKGCIKPWPYIKGANVRDVRVLNRLRIGHTHITHKYLMSNPQVVPDCNWCNGILTIKHILVDCPGLVGFRNKWQIPESMMQILGDNVDLPSLVSFLKDIGIFYKI